MLTDFTRGRQCPASVSLPVTGEERYLFLAQLCSGGAGSAVRRARGFYPL